MARSHLLSTVALGLALASPAGSATPARDDTPVRLEVFPLAAVRPVEPLAYGANEGGHERCTLRRHGGNRFTAFDWETSASHAGADWKHQHDWYMAPEPEARGPGALLGRRLGRDREWGARSLVTLQLAGYVAADADGPVSEEETAPGPRWKRVSLEPTEPGPEGWAPDLDDDVVYVDEQVRDLVRRFGTAEEGGVLAYALDNEPALWSHTHARLHPRPATWEEVTSQGIAAARLVTAEDPTALVFGPVLYGWAAYADLQGAPDAARHRGRDRTFTRHYLRLMREASEASGRRLLHRLDIHWYPEATGEARVASDAVDDATARARVQAPRSLWDATYRERSWIADVAGGPIRLIPRLREEIDAVYPGTGLAVTEYSFGAAGHVSGGLAQADALGIFGRHGVVACYWSLGGPQEYVESAFALYLEPGAGLGGFGDVSVHALAGDDELAAVHAAADSDDPDRLTVVVVSRRLDGPLDVELAVRAGPRAFTEVQHVGFDSSSPELRPLGRPTLDGDVLRHTLPAGAAVLYELRRPAEPPR